MKSNKVKSVTKRAEGSVGDLSLKHLHAELSRIDVLIRREVQRFQAAGQNPLDTFRGLFISDAKASSLAARPFATSWGQTVSLDAAVEAQYAQAGVEAAMQGQAIAAQAVQQQQTLRLFHLASAFGLSRFEVDALLVILAPALDLRYERLYGYLQDDVTRKRPSVNMVLELLCPAGPERLLQLAQFADDAPLFRNRIVSKAVDPSTTHVPLLNQTLFPDEGIVRWLLGDYRPHTEFGRHAKIEWPQLSEVDNVLAAEYDEIIQRAASSQPLIVFHGPDSAGQEAAAHLLANRLGRPLLTVDIASAISDETAPLQIIRLALRDARLMGAVPFLMGWDVCLTEGAPQANLLAELYAYTEPIVVAGRAAWQSRGIDRERNLFWLEFPIPEYPKRKAVWTYFLKPHDGIAEADQALLAGQFALTADQIRDTVSSARDLAAQRGSAVEAADLFGAARSHSSPGLSGQARKLAPRYTWSDIVLPKDQLTILHEIIATVRGRPIVLEEWGVGKKLTASDGVTVLFAGPPGTGKTMAAEVIASELQLDLYKIELSSLVSKFIGETEKNLERIFKEAESSNAILFFDEADAIFGKRSEVKDAHDRYANIEVSYLLQRMESYDGVTVLATNLRANLDDAFTRRLSFALDFPFPDEQNRLRIWQTLFPASVPKAPDLDLEMLARRFRLAGGNIRNIIVSAAYLAAADGGSVTMDHLFHSARRELQKMGRLVKESDLKVA